MACNAQLLNGGISLGCENNSGGVRKIYITDYVNVTGLTEQAGGVLVSSGEVISNIAMAAGTFFYDFEFLKNTSSYQETATISLENGTSFFTQTITLVIPRREQAKRNKIALLAAGQKKLVVIVQDSNQLYWYFGEEEGCILTAIDGGSGVAKTDANSYTLTFTAEEPAQAKEVLSSAITTIVSPNP
jgi:hypothetical protein